MRGRPFWRRDPIGRIRRRGSRFRPGLRALRRAHELALSGETEQAALRFRDLAEKAVKHGAANAPQIYLQAGRLFAQFGSSEDAWLSFKTGLTLMNEAGPPRQLARAARMVVRGLDRHGLSDLADRVLAFVSELLPAAELPDLRAGGGGQESGLPGKCPYCGASVDPRDIEWLQDDRAICEYCGSLLES